MKAYKLNKILTENGWINDPYITVDSKGRFQEITQQAPDVDIDQMDAWAMPGIPNTHSHSFQFAMAGQAEFLPKEAKGDDFWSWRKAMYSLAQEITPEAVQEIVTPLYKEMLENGYTSIVEFHYLHHQKDGTPYESETEIAERLLEAAKEAEVALTIIPVYYQCGGFGKEALKEQSRFLFSNVDHYLKYLDKLANKAANYENARVGFGVHSLRAANKEDIKSVLEGFDSSAPFHIHIAEQTKEVEDCQEFYGARPVQWLLDNFNVDDRFNLVHATHIDESERKGIINSGANVVLCPSTEANLGDGIFPLKEYHHEGGKWSIGSDSNVSRNPFEELRWLDYGQRLIHRVRNPLCKPGGPSSGVELIQSAIKNGRKACGLSEKFYVKGEVFDVMTFDTLESPSTLIFS